MRKIVSNPRYTKTKFIAYLDKEYAKLSREQVFTKFSYLLTDMRRENELLRAWIQKRLGRYIASVVPEAVAKWHTDWVREKLNKSTQSK